MSQEKQKNLFAGMNPVTGGTPVPPPNPEEPMWEALIGKIIDGNDRLRLLFITARKCLCQMFKCDFHMYWFSYIF